MDEVVRRPRPVRFGVFEVDLCSGELRKHGLKIKLQEQPFQILAMLLERPGEVVTREGLRRKLWPEDTFVDFDNSLNTGINKIREALGDSADNPRFVETLPRRGYRFIAPVDVGAGLVPAQGRPQGAPLRVRWGLGLAAGLTAAVALAVAAWFWVRPAPRPAPPEAPLTAVPLTAYPGFEEFPSFSPDGTQVAFSWNGENEDNFDIYVKVVGSEPPLRLTTNPAREFSPAWSPDGRWVASGRVLPGNRYAVVLIPPTGGPERVLTELNSPADLQATFNVQPPFLAWSPDSTWLAMVAEESPGAGPAALYSYSLANGESRRLTSPPGSIEGDGSPAFSPDGRTLAFCRQTSFSTGALYLLGLTRGLKRLADPTLLTAYNWWPTGLTWTTDGRSLVLSSFVGVEPRLWRVDASGGRSPLRLYSGGVVSHPAIPRRGNRLAYAETILEADIWRMEMPSSGRKASPPLKLISSTRLDCCPQFSPDGKKVVFISGRSGTWEAWICDSDGSNPLQVTSYGGAEISPPQWSPDGSRLTFAANPEGRYEIFIVDANGGSPKRLNSGAGGADNPSWSRDGRWIFYDILDVANRGIWKVPAEGGPPVPATSEYWAAMEAPQGDWIYVRQTTPAGFCLWRVPSKGGEPQKVLESLSGHLNYALVKGGIFYIPRSDPQSGYSLQFLNTVTGSIERIASFDKPVYGISVSPDRRWILFAQIEQLGSDLMLVESFR